MRVRLDQARIWRGERVRELSGRFEGADSLTLCINGTTRGACDEVAIPGEEEELVVALVLEGDALEEGLLDGVQAEFCAFVLAVSDEVESLALGGIAEEEKARGEAEVGPLVVE